MVDTSPSPNLDAQLPSSLRQSQINTQNKTQSSNYLQPSTHSIIRTSKKRARHHVNASSSSGPPTPSTLLKRLRISSEHPPQTRKRSSPPSKDSSFANLNPPSKRLKHNQHVSHSIMPDPSDPSGQAIEGKCGSPIHEPPVENEKSFRPLESATSLQGFDAGKYPPKPHVPILMETRAPPSSRRR